MQRVSANHRALGRSIDELDARKVKLSHLDNSVPSVSLPVDVNVNNGNGGDAQPSSTSPNPQPPPTPAADGMGSGGDPGGSTPTPPALTTSGGETAVPAGSIVTSSTSPTSAPGNQSSSSGANNASSGGSLASSSSSGGVGNFLGISGGQSTPVNTGPASSTAASAALGTSTYVALAMASPSPSQYLLGSGSSAVGATSSSQTITTSALVSPGKQLSGGAIAGITIVCLVLLFSLILVVFRRRSIARRVKLRRQWWSGRRASSGNFSLVNNGSPRASSARSSFATNFDQGLMHRVHPPSKPSPGVVPDLPPMAEVRERSSVLISTGGATARRESMNSMLSNGSEPDAQYLTVSGQDDLEHWRPMSVRPFSPSESFAFPKPPAPTLSTADSFFLSRTQGPGSSRSSATLVHPLVHLSTPSRAFMTDLPPASVTAPSLYPQASTSSVSLPPFIAAVNPSLDTFAGPEKPGSADIQVIRRVFNPSLDDELAVRPGDHIRLLQIFDDGWASIEKLAGAEGEPQERGLIPVDCLREADQALPTSLTQKRVSNYESDQLIATAL